jgi:hypothetical protein
MAAIVTFFPLKAAGRAHKVPSEEGFTHLTFMDPCIIVQFINKNPTRCNNVSKFYYSISM